jgi:hypothetical protein
MPESILTVNMLLALASSIFMIFVARKDHTPFRWVRYFVSINLAYMVALYAHGSYQTKIVVTFVFFEPANLLLIYILARSIQIAKHFSRRS